MRLSETLAALRLMPMAIKHLLIIQQQLKNKSYQQIIQQKYPIYKPSQPINSIVKSYFWSCRIIKNCQCLPRSIALYQHLNSAGYKVKHRFGVNKTDQKLNAHAWVEHKNKALNEAENLLLKFEILETFAKTSNKLIPKI